MSFESKHNKIGFLLALNLRSFSEAYWFYDWSFKSF